MMYVDAHCHLMPDEIYLQAQKAGVRIFVVNATKPGDWQPIYDLGRRVLGIYPCVGIHPWFVDNLPPDWVRQLERCLLDNPDAMIGEIGLDATRPFYPLQKQVFATCLDLASRYRRKVHIHCVKAWPDLFDIFGQYREVTALLHRFSGDETIIQKLRLFNVYFSVLNGRYLNVIPDNKVLIESDAPDGIGSPTHIPEIVKTLGLSPDHLMQNWESFINE